MMLQRAVILDEQSYGRWKVRMVQLIRNLGEDAWTAVEEGWEPPYEKTEAGDKITKPKPPYEKTEAGDKITKPKARWTVEEKNLSKYNARALNAIFGAIDDDEFKLVQGCESAKDAWDILEKTHEGNSSVKRTRLDQLASQFEVLRMDPEESISQFSAKLSVIANEAKNLGKIYKNTKLVKKLIRCLPSKYAAHKAVMRVSGNTYTLKFEDLVGMLKSEEMKVSEELRIHGKGIAFKADDRSDQLKEIKDNMCLMARNFGKALKRVEKGQGRELACWNQTATERSCSRPNISEKEKSNRRKEIQCLECGGFGHYKLECPMVKRKEMKCFECKKIGHLKSECPNMVKGNKIAYVSFNDSESETDESSYDDDEESISKESYCILYDNWVQLCNEKLLLVQEKLKLEAKVNMLEDRKREVLIGEELPPAEKELFERKLRNLQEKYSLEKEKATSLERELNENHKKIRMLNNGGKKLDEILSMGIVGSQHRGLGYHKEETVELLSRDKSVSFVKSNSTHETESSILGKVVQQEAPVALTRNKFNLYPLLSKKFKNKINELWMARKCFIDPSHFCKVWVAKQDLYSKVSEHNERQYNQIIHETEEINLFCNLSKIITEDDVGVEPEVLQKHVADHLYKKQSQLNQLDPIVMIGMMNHQES
ncbi:PREDICTED: uncharacterized protein LOC104709699 [Camelina sativa]|uniref:Uncharacterized protein LOC104709699 n=1 Tax=Camelina sativa TaxID=90675 RepID=A0ABM0TD67_CAMSA|nr:PREDICTED: uncharacterized protein LOC104709699 [Camelina sativa]